jgi:hypothetical protein
MKPILRTIISTTISRYDSLDIRATLAYLLYIFATIHAERNKATQPSSHQQARKPAPSDTARWCPQNVVSVLVAVWTSSTALLIDGDDSRTLLLWHHPRSHHWYVHSHHLWALWWTHHRVHGHIGRRRVHWCWRKQGLAVMDWLSVHYLEIYILNILNIQWLPVKVRPILL